jgi:hypothetical protein
MEIKIKGSEKNIKKFLEIQKLYLKRNDLGVVYVSREETKEATS